MKITAKKGMTCKVILDNNYVYHGLVEDFNDFNLILKDRYGSLVVIDKKRVSVFEEIKA